MNALVPVFPLVLGLAPLYFCGKIKDDDERVQRVLGIFDYWLGGRGVYVVWLQPVRDHVALQTSSEHPYSPFGTLIATQLLEREGQHI